MGKGVVRPNRKSVPSREPRPSNNQKGDAAPGYSPYVEYTKHKLRAFLDEIERLQDAEFPYPHSKEAFDLLQRHFAGELAIVNGLSEREYHRDVVRRHCTTVLRSLLDYLPRIGVALRSTNVRNAFEVFGPFLRLAGDILEPGVARRRRRTRLLLSSEWDYSPLTFPFIPALPYFVLIGLPAPESSNPLLLPLAGHELGHSVWRLNSAFKDVAQGAVNSEVIQAFKARSREAERLFPALRQRRTRWWSGRMKWSSSVMETWEPAAKWALRQAEETFCDFVGLGVFGDSYLHAFAYLFAPGAGSNLRVVTYPQMRTRASNLRRAADAYRFSTPDGYEALFEEDEAADLTSGDQFRLAVADSSVARLCPLLIERARDVVRAGGIEGPSMKEVSRIYRSFERVVPAERCRSLPDIINAGWHAFTRRDFWRDLPQLRDRKHPILAELILKNIEVLQMEQKRGVRR